MHEIVLEINNFAHLFADQFEITIQEFLNGQNDLKILGMKVEELEGRIGKFATEDHLWNDRHTTLRSEVDTLRKQK